MWTLGVDIGATKTEWMLFDASGAVVQHQREATAALAPSPWLVWLRQCLAPAMQHGSLLRIGIAFPGVLTQQGVLRAANLPLLDGQLTLDMLQQALAFDVVAGNDCRLAGWAEARLGAGRGVDKVLNLRLGTGLGGGFCLAGQLYSGQQGVACEVGHQSMAAAWLAQHQLPLWRCGCGQLGCVEQYVSGRGLLQLYQHATHLPAVPTLMQWQLAFAAAEPAALKAWQQLWDGLGCVIAAQQLAFDAELVVLSGGVVAAGVDLDAVQHACRLALFSGVELPAIRLAELTNSSCYGAALLAGAEFNAPSARLV